MRHEITPHSQPGNLWAAMVFAAFFSLSLLDGCTRTADDTVSVFDRTSSDRVSKSASAPAVTPAPYPSASSNR